MKHRGPSRPVARQKQHVRDVVAMLREMGAEAVTVTQPRHYRVSFVLGGRQMALGVASTPTIAGDAVKHARKAVERMLNGERPC